MNMADYAIFVLFTYVILFPNEGSRLLREGEVGQHYGVFGRTFWRVLGLPRHHEAHGGRGHGVAPFFPCGQFPLHVGREHSYRLLGGGVV